MAKFLSESSWTGFTKKQKLELDDKPLIKALAKFDKASPDKPEPLLDALEEVVDQVRKQVLALAKRKKELGDKPFNEAKDQLYAVLDEAEKLQKQTRDAASKASADKDDDDTPGSALLEPKLLLAQLNLCKRDPDRKANFAFVDGKDKAPAVLAMSPKVSGRKLFSKLQDATGVKTGAFGSAWLDGTSLMLQLDKPMGGLVKKIRGPVKACGFRISKAVLWNADGSVFEQDASMDDEEADADAPAAPAGQTPPSAPPAASAEDTGAGARFNARLAALVPRLKALAPPAVAEIKLTLGEAAMFARKQDFAQAQAVLDEAERLLALAARPAAQATEQPAAQAAPDPAAAFNARLAALLPAVKAALLAAGPQAPELKLKVSEAGALARQKSFAQAQALLDGIEDLLAIRSETADASPAPAIQALQARLSKLERNYLRVMKLDPPERTRLTALMGLSTESLQAGDASKAATNIDALEKLLQSDGVGTRPAVRTIEQQLGQLVRDPGQMVAYRQALLKWDGARKQARSQLQGLRAEIGSRSPALAAPAAVLEKVMDRLDSGLSNAINAAINEPDIDQRASLHEEAAMLARSYLMTVNFNPLFATLDRNPIQPLSLRTVLGDALKQVVMALPA